MRRYRKWLLGIPGVVLLISLPVIARYEWWPNLLPTPSNQQLNETAAWFRKHPYSPQTLDERKHYMRILQTACDKVSDVRFERYETCWGKNPRAARRMAASGALYYLARTMNRARQEIHSTEVRRGVVVWYLYNMGYVVKTPTGCFGIDVHLPDAVELAPDLDFLLGTHYHHDHNDAGLIRKMVAMGKPVVTRPPFAGHLIGLEGNRYAPTPRRFTFNGMTVKVDVGDHEADTSDDMLMYQIDCGPKANGFTIYHSGDGGNVAKMHPDRPIDLFIIHVQIANMSLEDAVNHIQPRTTFVSHVMELSHTRHLPCPRRCPYWYAFFRARHLQADRFAVLTWGERWAAPDTKFGLRQHTKNPGGESPGPDAPQHAN